MRKHYKKSIVTQTVFRVSAVFILALLLLIFAFTFFISTYMREKILESQQKQMETVSMSLEGRLNGLREMAVSFAKYQPTISFLDEYYEKYSIEWMENKRALDNYLQNVNFFTEYIVDINLINTNSETIYSLRDVLKSDYPYTEQTWFAEALKQDGIIKYIRPHGNDHLYQKLGDTISVIYPVMRANKLLGYEMIECHLYGVADFLKKSKSDYILLDDTMKSIFGDKEGNVVRTLSSDLTGMKAGTYDIYQEKGTIYSVYKFKTNHWTLILKSDKNIVLQPIKTLFLVVGIVAVLTMIILTRVNIYNVKVMEKPFHVLLSRINSYDGSIEDEPYDYKNAPRELAMIGERFEKMAEKVNGLIKDVYVAQLRQKEAELDALINQINPHFLYNVFQLIQTKAVLSDNQEIEEMIQSLSQMMRYTMERKRMKVTVGDELDYIENYLMFYKERFPNLFVSQIICNESIKDYATIKFVLQPIVENCFKHAFRNRKTGGEIKIEVKEFASALEFKVWDNGCGMSEEHIRNLYAKMNGEFYRSGIGMINTNERIRLVYGYPYGIEITSVLEEYTEVTVKIRKEGYENV